MERAVRVWLAFAATATSLGWAKAEAQEAAGAVPVRVRYTVVAGCPGEEAFFDQLRARAPRVRRAAPHEEAATFDVAVAPERGRLAGRIFVEDAMRASRPSQVAARSCDDVVAALALIAALSIDPRSGSAAPAMVPAAAQGATTSPPRDLPPIATPAAAAPEPAALAVPVPAAPSEPTGAAQPAEPPRDRLPLSISPPKAKTALAHVSAVVGLDSVYAGIPVFARLGAQMRADWSRGFALGLGVAASEATLDRTNGGARLQWMTANVEACAFRLPLSAAVSVVPCIPLEGGLLSVTGTGAPNTVTQQRPWFTVGGLARLELALSARFLVEARVGLAAPLVRDTFYFLPNTDVFRPPAVVGTGGLGVGVRFL
jgi:hypothetical protein